MNEKKNDEKSSRWSTYTLDKKKRGNFLFKIIPTLLIGNLVWLLSTLWFIFLFTNNLIELNFWILYSILVVISIVIFIGIHIYSHKNQQILVIILFLSFCFISGIHGMIFVNVNQEFSKQVLMFVSANLGGISIVFLVGLTLKEKFMAEGYIWATMILFLIYLAIISTIYYLIFDIHNWLLTIPITLSYFCIISLVIMFYGPLTINRSEESHWTYVIYKILRVLVLSLVIAVIVAIIVLVAIILGILSEGNVDFSGINYYRSKKKKKKKKKEN
ncbi:MAG: membrane protein of unknown function [Promethearchaeota archaeon]|nr:MAG: membrane protein of unknown function [Candidatus Lokiarchaeota archaeon]